MFEFEYLHEFETICEFTLGFQSGAEADVFREEKLRWKISWNCPFNSVLATTPRHSTCISCPIPIPHSVTGISYIKTYSNSIMQMQNAKAEDNQPWKTPTIFIPRKEECMENQTTKIF
jgi:hypothetical protein